MSARTAVRVTLLALATAAGAVAAFGSALVHLGERGAAPVEHPPYRGLAALLGASALAGAALSGRSRPVAAAGLAAAAALGLLGAHRLAWRIEAVEAGLCYRTIAGWTRIASRDVERVEPRPEALRVRAPDGREMVVGARGFSAEAGRGSSGRSRGG